MHRNWLIQVLHLAVGRKFDHCIFCDIRYQFLLRMKFISESLLKCCKNIYAIKHWRKHQRRLQCYRGEGIYRYDFAVLLCWLRAWSSFQCHSIVIDFLLMPHDDPGICRQHEDVYHDVRLLDEMSKNTDPLIGEGKMSVEALFLTAWTDLSLHCLIYLITSMIWACCFCLKHAVINGFLSRQ